uniref:Kunitz-type trypsin inhibitor beta chain n=2 Tax=Neltuma TaxID=3082578 RepID=ID5B_NELJU|nr:RecName: Full=Kunitz-type trypsin inhibitor beta chain [Prosopis juliflora]AAB21122.1 Kunitz trypsin inhibitor beta chain [Prosopsis juliflora, seeds, Peptide, 38 aa] [Prosopis juliflora]
SDRCKDLGISIDEENNRRLVVKDGDPLAVRFVKANRRG